ncbi:MAG: O-antigen ligase family protein [Alphaproteobacteria bacterium]|nr:O-antigen ligase family protein [Alphaproteobacteria bacterium]
MSWRTRKRAIVHRLELLRGQSAYWVFAALVLVVTLTGGGARADIESLILLRPVAALLLFAGLVDLQAAQFIRFRMIFGLYIVCVMLVTLSLIPLPPALWHSLPGHSLIRDIDHAAGLGDGWRPLSVEPVATWNALFSLLVPGATLVWLARMTREQRVRLLPLLIGVGALGAIIGLLQSISGADSVLYFYSVTNASSAVGFFANRNHQAAFLACLFPMLATYACAGLRTAEQATRRKWLALAVGAALIPLILVTGSRMGLLSGLIGLCSTVLIYRVPQSLIPKRRRILRFNPAYLYGSIFIILLGLISFMTTRAQAINRLLGVDSGDDDRWSMWVPSWAMLWKYFPFGSGAGSFVATFQTDEPGQVLVASYANHAHNDFLELAMTMGLPGLAGLALLFWILGRDAMVIWRSRASVSASAILARAALAMAVIMLVSSITDYPLRTPFLAMIGVIALVWLEDGGDPEKG